MDRLDHPLLLHISHLTTALENFQHEAHSSAVKLQHHSLTTSRAIDHAHSLKHENNTLNNELTTLRSLSSQLSNSSESTIQINQLTLSLRTLTEKLSITENLLLQRTRELSNALVEISKSRASIDAAYELASRIRGREELLCSRERELELKLRLAEEKARMSEKAIEEYADFVRILQGQSPTTMNGKPVLNDGEVIENLLKEFAVEREELQTQLSTSQHDLAVTKAQLEAQTQTNQLVTSQLAQLQFKLDQLERDDNTAAKMVSRYMKFSQQSTNTLQNTLTSLQTRHSATLTSYTTQIQSLQHQLHTFDQLQTKLIQTLDQLGGEILKESFGRRREVRSRIKLVGREERIVEELKRWLRRSEERVTRLENQDPNTLLTEMIQDAKILIDNLDNPIQLSNSNDHIPITAPISGSLARLITIQSTVDDLVDQLHKEQTRRIELEGMLIHREIFGGGEALERYEEGGVSVQRNGQPMNPSSPSSPQPQEPPAPVPEHPPTEHESELAESTHIPTHVSRRDGIMEGIPRVQRSEQVRLDGADEVGRVEEEINIMEERKAEEEAVKNEEDVRRDDESSDDDEGSRDRQVEVEVESIKSDEAVKEERDTIVNLQGEEEPKVDPDSRSIIQVNDALIQSSSDPTSNVPPPLNLDITSTPPPPIPHLSLPPSPPPPTQPNPHPLLQSLLQSRTRYTHIQRSFHDCHIALESLKSSLPSSSSHIKSSSKIKDNTIPNEILRVIIQRLDDYTEDIRVELEIRISDEEVLSRGYEALICVPGALESSSSNHHDHSLTEDERLEGGMVETTLTEIETQILSFVNGTDPVIQKALNNFEKKLEDLEHDIAVVKKVVYDPQDSLSTENLMVQQQDSGGGGGWTSWIRNTSSSSSRPTTPTPLTPTPTFGNIMTNRSSSSSSSILRRTTSTIGFSHPNSNTNGDVIKLLGLKTSMPDLHFILSSNRLDDHHHHDSNDDDNVGLGIGLNRFGGGTPRSRTVSTSTTFMLGMGMGMSGMSPIGGRKSPIGSPLLQRQRVVSAVPRLGTGGEDELGKRSDEEDEGDVD